MELPQGHADLHLITALLTGLAFHKAACLSRIFDFQVMRRSFTEPMDE